ncbi:dTDP-4-dehydrorhamnose 3,5-epimerase [Paraglaciecola sp. MB-3u-78]|uniref:dTDP-4-dehydrorhamnose 3,5-epimerase n=1 Tax=Paraglaciecola sp. MB-3u-78 TaxID=2058332 RepID=UPI000C321C2C|nr:dTDP-4-dehydrorhamnose 3,5-epimerase [Paraglaciecola sp. MB-3u-78]PKG98770.1 dTDP-4-dehydrorhamnose 3,5-epimerase [Paraglaciecola sp. MB-3u-78]
MRVTKTKLNDVLIFEPKIFGDERGFFMETFRKDIFTEQTGIKELVQDNHSKSAQGILRGLHYQLEHTQGKLVRVTQGSVFDVAVDLRQSSSTYGQWFGLELSARNNKQLWVPAGFAHGFYVTGETAEFVYKCTDYYHPQSEVSIKWDDPSLAINWPLVNGEQPSLSAKDVVGESFLSAPKFA